MTIKTLFTAIFVVAAIAAVSPAAQPQTSPRQVIDFDADWRFAPGDASGAEKIEFDDSRWRKLDVPHDWSIEGAFDRNNLAAGAGAFLPAGIGWYRKSFVLPAASAGRRILIEFDGVMANSDVWINGSRVGARPYGYVSFYYDLTAQLLFGNKLNVLAVRADNSRQPASRWYAGAGIYRHVRLIVTGEVHVETWSTFVTTPRVNDGEAAVRVQSTVVNQSDSAQQVALRITIVTPDGKPLRAVETESQSIAPGKSAEFSREVVVKNPHRWDLEDPELYTAITGVIARRTAVDEVVTPFGIREFRFDASTGFWLNGRNFKLKGVCLHHDGGAFGAAVPLRVWERRLETLKQLGVNAIRTAHNPPAPEFLDLCDRMGFLVMDELFDCWTVAKNPYDYHLYFDEWSRIDVRDTVRRDRNHPSIVLYSAGNEIHDTPNAELSKRILKGLIEVFHENDPTRPVTQALFRPNVSHDYDNGLADLLDVIGTNYRDAELLDAHKARPERKIIGTEQGHERRTWLAMRDNPQHSGQFLWSGIDYLGESRQWPAIANNSGLLDRTGTPKPLAYERQSWWSDRPMVRITRRVAPAQAAPTDPGYEAVPQRRTQMLFSDWSPRTSEPHEEIVEVYSNCEQVELFLNDKSLGARMLPADGAPRVWKVQFQAGVIKAIATNKGKVVATHHLRTAGKPAKILLTVDRTRLSLSWDDVVLVEATIVDENGVLVPSAGDLISFQIRGPGVVAAVDNADSNSHESFQASGRHAFQGRCFAMIKGRATRGWITVSASAPGLVGKPVSIEVAGPAAKR